MKIRPGVVWAYFKQCHSPHCQEMYSRAIARISTYQAILHWVYERHEYRSNSIRSFPKGPSGTGALQFSWVCARRFSATQSMGKIREVVRLAQARIKRGLYQWKYAVEMQYLTDIVPYRPIYRETSTTACRQKNLGTWLL